jgi:hypothetical protein
LEKLARAYLIKRLGKELDAWKPAAPASEA